MASNHPTSLGEALARVFWLMAGPATLSLLAITMAQSYSGWFAPRSVAFLAVVVGIGLARWFDPRDSFGELASPAQRRRYVAVAAVLGIAGWVATNLLGIFWPET
jgi:hypothetical protein